MRGPTKQIIPATVAPTINGPPFAGTVLAWRRPPVTQTMVARIAVVQPSMKHARAAVRPGKAMIHGAGAASASPLVALVRTLSLIHI